MYTAYILICTYFIRQDANREFKRSLKDFCNLKSVPYAKLHPDFRSRQIEIFVAKMKRKKRKEDHDERT